MVIADFVGILELKTIFYFTGILIGWFTFYFLIDALKKVEEITKKKINWKIIYFSLPFLMISPVAHIHSLYNSGGMLYGIENAVANFIFMISGALLFFAMYSFKTHLKVKLVNHNELTIAFFVALGTMLIFLSRITDVYAFISMATMSLGLFLIALSFWIIASYSKQFETIYPMSDFLIVASLILIAGQIVQSYAFGIYYTNIPAFITMDFAGNIFIFIAFLIAAISTFVFKKTVLEFNIHIAPMGGKKGGS